MARRREARNCYPPPDTNVHFEAGTIFATNIGRKTLFQRSGKHRGQQCKVEKGYLLIDHQWEVIEEE